MSYIMFNVLPKKEILGISVTNATQEEILEYVGNFLQNSSREVSNKLSIVTPNPEIIVAAQKRKTLRIALNQAQIALCDGIGILWASRLLGRSLKERFSGVDFIEKVCGLTDKQPITMGFLGGRQGVADKTAECLKRRYPRIEVVCAKEEWEEDKSMRLPIDILFVAFGFPKQEEWIEDNLPKLPVRVAIGVGGAFDYLSGKVPRAPQILRTFGLEWLFRLFVQPWRIKRQIALAEFVFLCLLQRIRTLFSERK